MAHEEFEEIKKGTNLVTFSNDATASKRIHGAAQRDCFYANLDSNAEEKITRAGEMKTTAAVVLRRGFLHCLADLMADVWFQWILVVKAKAARPVRRLDLMQQGLDRLLKKCLQPNISAVFEQHAHQGSKWDVFNGSNTVLHRSLPQPEFVADAVSGCLLPFRTHHLKNGPPGAFDSTFGPRPSTPALRQESQDILLLKQNVEQKKTRNCPTPRATGEAPQQKDSRGF